jgi:hypothetical protein
MTICLFPPLPILLLLSFIFSPVYYPICKIPTHRYAVPDAEKVPYFYNPLSGEMQWTRPYGTRLCEKCNLDFGRRWVYKVPPTRPGQVVKVTIGSKSKPTVRGNLSETMLYIYIYISDHANALPFT